MAPESERAKPFEQLAELLKEAGAVPVLELGGFKIVLDNSLPENEIRLRSGGQAARLVNLALEPTLTCSEVVERLRNEAMVDIGGSRPQLELDPTKATAILHSWRERRVQELEELLAKHSLTPELLPTQLPKEK